MKYQAWFNDVSGNARRSALFPGEYTMTELHNLFSDDDSALAHWEDLKMFVKLVKEN